MKKLILLFVLLSTLATAQELKFSEVYESEKNQNELYSLAKLWISESYNDAQSVIKLDDKENGIILLKATKSYRPNFFLGKDGARGYIDYTLKISVKDNKYKIDMYDFTHDGADYFDIGLITDTEDYVGKGGVSTKGFRNRVQKDCREQIKSYAPSIMSSIKLALSKERVKESW